MAVPKQKTSKERKRIRSAHNFKAHTDPFQECPHCHSPKQPHKVCPNCGYYNGKQVIESAQERKEKKTKAKETK
jgi:large subunit ribosomal protein L32